MTKGSGGNPLVVIGVAVIIVAIIAIICNSAAKDRCRFTTEGCPTWESPKPNESNMGD